MTHDPTTTTDRKTMLQRLRQRGATLTGYALIMAGMVAVSLGAVEGLDRGSTEVLENTGASIGESRPTRDQLAEAIEEEDPDPDTEPEEPDPTYDWGMVYDGVIQASGGSDDLCIVNDGGDAKTAPCTTSTGLFEFFDNDDDDGDLLQLRIDGLCVTRITTNGPTALAACQDGNADQLWLQTPSGNLASEGGPGECIDIEGGVGAGRSLLSYNCHGGANQTFSFPGPYVPPVTAVTSVDASSATLTAPMQLAPDGSIYAPDGTGRSINTPDPSLGTATFTFTVEAGGDYKINGSVYAEEPDAGGNNSFWIETTIDGVTDVYKWGFGTNTTPENDFVNDNNGGDDVVITVPDNATFTIRVIVREDGAHLSSLNLVQL